MQGGYFAFRRPTANAKASRALMLIRKFKKEEEKKIIHTDLNFAALVSATMQFQGLVYTAQGNTKTTRIGNKITLESLAVRLSSKLSDGETLGGILRLMIVVDRRPAGAQAAASDFLNNEAVESLYTTSEANQGRFQILYDQSFNYNVSGVQMRTHKFFIPLKGLKVSYTSNLGTVADIQKNNVFLAAITTNNDNNMSLVGDLRIRFTDA